MEKQLRYYAYKTSVFWITSSFTLFGIRLAIDLLAYFFIGYYFIVVLVTHSREGTFDFSHSTASVKRRMTENPTLR